MTTTALPISRSSEPRQSRPEGLYLRMVIKLFYRFVRDQGYEYYESVDGKFVRRERDHNRMIGHDDVGQLFWY